jgi:hypothetical protein
MSGNVGSVTRDRYDELVKLGRDWAATMSSARWRLGEVVRRGGRGEKVGRGLALVGQDNLRRTVLRERDRPGAANIGLIELTARYAQPLPGTPSSRSPSTSARCS